MAGPGPEQDSIWMRPERAARGPAPAFDRDRLAAAGVSLADADGLAAVTMRAVAAALGSGPASLYRYVTTRDELLELMIDRVTGEIPLGPATGRWQDDLLALARGARDVRLAHPWLPGATASHAPLGPHAVAYLEAALAALAPLPASPRTKLEAVGVLTTVVSGLAGAELTQRAAGRTIPQWQAAQAAYLTAVAAAGRHPHLTAALTPAAAAAPEPAGELFDRVVRRVLAGLLGPDAG